jgi:hypothetical protein
MNNYIRDNALQYKINNSAKMILHFDEGIGQLAYDSSGNGNNGVITNATWILGKDNYGLSFDDVDERVQINNLLFPQPISFCGWVNLEVFTSDQNIFSISNQRMRIYLPANAPYLYCNYYDGYSWINLYDWNILTSGWHHLAFTKSINGSSFYVDGDLADSNNNSADIAYVGNTFYCSSCFNYSYLKGSIDEVYLFNKELTSDEVKSIFNYGINQEEDNSFWLNIKMIFPLIYISYLVLLIFTIIYLSIKD